MAYELIKGILPIAASPDATDARFCSATPSWINRFGNFSLNIFILVDSVRSAQRPTTCKFFSPAAKSPSPNPWRIGICSTFSSNIFSFSFKRGLSITGAHFLFYHPRYGVRLERLRLACQRGPYPLGLYQAGCRASGSHVRIPVYLYRRWYER